MPVDVKGSGIGSPSGATTTIDSETGTPSEIFSTSVSSSQVTVTTTNFSPQTVTSTIPDNVLVNLNRTDTQKLSDLKDVDITGQPANGFSIIYSTSQNAWIPAAVTSSGVLTGETVRSLLEDVNSQVLTETSVNAATIGTHVVDSFSINTLRSAKYIITINDSDDTTYYITEILLIHNNATVSFTQYGEVMVGSIDISPTFSTDIVGGQARLKATTVSNSQTIKVSRIGAKI